MRRLALIALLLALPASAGNLRRFAVVVGNDEGGSGTRPLLYARDDARRIANILQRLGGVRSEDLTLVLNGTAEELTQALAKTERAAVAAKEQGDNTALFLYYSGHAKDGALRLGDTAYSFSSLKTRLSQAPVDVRIGIFDACQSGLLTRTKGARKAPEFAIETDAAHESKGLVILTSSSSDEDSQESDQISGSYFSHHLASGMLGDADRSGDGRVTLAEAYAYAYERTVADTAQSAAGAQHPTFSYDLQGNGDLVLTDVFSHREGILFPSIAPDGTYYVIVEGRGTVAAEIIKEAEKEKRIALAPGKYLVKRRLPDKLRIGEFEVASGQVALFDESRMHDAPFSDDPVKGVDRTIMLSNKVSLGVGFALQSFFDSPDLFPPTATISAEVELHNFWHREWNWAFDATLGTARSTLSLQRYTLNLPFTFGELDFGTSVIKEWNGGKLVPFVGARVAAVILTRTFDPSPDAPVLPHQFFATLSPGLVTGAKYRVTKGFSVWMRARGQYVYYNVDQPAQSMLLAELSLGMNVDL